ncbi:uncharacterized protein BJ171DRAFT_202084 [Polychytrium aggregatum]|uniref:uncharacterized protein n=1 Tax=Polychytrium aggregatum TaxID=110093 RepID=UPI0022FEAD0F|nr:uncharacterized protein BJ171DRAFT_202084 [Polychytrium aggregatum]KAI9199751.1 hypothetical protein BJ171DRAFT_202084 [Polychytrium aggregatum]
MSVLHVDNAPAGVKRYAKAKWNYNAIEDNEISFSAGDLIEVVALCNEDWYEGRVRNEQGYFPANRVELLPESPKPAYGAVKVGSYSSDQAPKRVASYEAASNLSAYGQSPSQSNSIPVWTAGAGPKDGRSGSEISEPARISSMHSDHAGDTRRYLRSEFGGSPTVSPSPSLQSITAQVSIHPVRTKSKATDRELGPSSGISGTVQPTVKSTVTQGDGSTPVPPERKRHIYPAIDRGNSNDPVKAQGQPLLMERSSSINNSPSDGSPTPVNKILSPSSLPPRTSSTATTPALSNKEFSASPSQLDGSPAQPIAIPLSSQSAQSTPASQPSQTPPSIQPTPVLDSYVPEPPVRSQPLALPEIPQSDYHFSTPRLLNGKLSFAADKPELLDSLDRPPTLPDKDAGSEFDAAPGVVAAPEPVVAAIEKAVEEETAADVANGQGNRENDADEEEEDDDDEEVELEGADIGNGWRLIPNNGEPYFWFPETGETTWVDPRITDAGEHAHELQEPTPESSASSPVKPTGEPEPVAEPVAEPAVNGAAPEDKPSVTWDAIPSPGLEPGSLTNAAAKIKSMAFYDFRVSFGPTPEIAAQLGASIALDLQKHIHSPTESEPASAAVDPFETAEEVETTGINDERESEDVTSPSQLQPPQNTLSNSSTASGGLSQLLQEARDGSLTLTSVNPVPPELVRREGPIQKKLKFEEGKKEPRYSTSWTVSYAIVCVGFLLFYKEDPSRAKKGDISLPTCVLPLTSATTIENGTNHTKKKYAVSLTTEKYAHWLLLFQTEKDSLKWIETLKECAREKAAPNEYEYVVSCLFTKDQNGAVGPSSSPQIQPVSIGDSTVVKAQKKKGFLAGIQQKHGAPADASAEEQGEKKSGRAAVFNFFRRPGEKGAGSKTPKMEAAVPDTSPEDVFGGYLDFHVDHENDMRIPMIVYQCCTEIESRGLESQGIYRLSGTTSHINNHRAQFNQRQPVALNEEDDINVVAALLKLYFRELHNPLFPFEFYQQFMDAARKEDYNDKHYELKELIQSLPKANYDVLEFLSRHLCRVAAQSDVNKMDYSNLAIVFGPTLIRTPETNAMSGYDSIANMSLHSMIVELILTKVDWFFDSQSGL